MDWFGVKLLYQIQVHGEAKKDGLALEKERRTYFEESVVLMRAESFDHAYERAKERAEAECGQYQNLYGQTVKQTFYEFVDCYWIGAELEEGTEVYSSIFCAQAANRELWRKARYGCCGAEEMVPLRNGAFAGEPSEQ